MVRRITDRTRHGDGVPPPAAVVCRVVHPPDQVDLQLGQRRRTAAGGRLSMRAADEVTHVLRHTFGTDLVRRGTDLVTVAELLGSRLPGLDPDLHQPTEDDLAVAVAVAQLTVDR